MANKAHEHAWLAGLVLLMALGHVATVRAADPAPEVRTQSNALFEEGKRKLDAGDLPAACRAFAESHRLLPRGGTLLNLAVCREREGALLAAFRTFHEALAVARQDDREDRVQFVLERIGAVEAQLSWVELRLPTVDPAGLTVRADGTPVVHEEWTAIPLDAGKHELTIEAPGFETWRTQITVAQTPKRFVVNVPLLSPAKVASTEPAASPAVPTPSQTELSSERRWRRVRLATASIGLAGLAVGAISGGLAIKQRNIVRAHCAGKDCDGEGKRAADRGDWLVDLSTASYVVGGVSLATWLVVPGGLLHPTKREVALTVVRRF